MSTKACNKCGNAMHQQPKGRWRCAPCDNAYQRRYYSAHPDVMRERKRLGMARARLDPEKRLRMQESQRRTWHNGGRERNRAYKEQQKREDFFGYHTQYVRRWNKNLTTEDLRALWESQNGICGLTGQPLVAQAGAAQVDHILPVSRGGSHDITNLRWVIKAANLSKRDLTDDEFLQLCLQVAQWLGARLLQGQI